MRTTEADWTTLEELNGCGPGEMRAVKRDGHFLVVGRDETGAPFALDNRCPHEGYPLAQGDLSGCALTCSWHNWKFDVRDGSCTLGGEDVRCYPTRERDGLVEVDLSDPDPAELVPKLLASLEQGVWRQDIGRAVRDGARLVKLGVTPRELALEVARIDARHNEYGSGHALPVAADCLRLLDGSEGPRALEALVLAIDMAAESIRRLPRRELADPIPGGDETSLRAAVESEDGVRAESLLLGRIDAGAPRAELDRLMYAVLADHFLSFGHPLIYQVKAQELLDGLEEADVRELYAGMLHGIVTATREDVLPYWAGHAERLAALDAEIPALASRTDPDAPFDPFELRAAVLDGNAVEAFGAVESALRAGVAPDRVARALVVAAAERLARFDPAVDADPRVAETWLWATHRFTYAAAVRHAVARWDDPRRWRLLFQNAAFVNIGRPMDGTQPLPEAAGDGTAASVIDAVAASRPGEAVAAARAFLAAGASIAELESALHELLLSDPLVRPIFVAHALKTTLAGIEEHRALAGEPDGDLPLLASLRFLASPHRERRHRATVGTQLRWVEDGKVPRKLTQ